MRTRKDSKTLFGTEISTQTNYFPLLSRLIHSVLYTSFIFKGWGGQEVESISLEKEESTSTTRLTTARRTPNDKRIGDPTVILPSNGLKVFSKNISIFGWISRVCLGKSLLCLMMLMIGSECLFIDYNK